MAKDNQGIKISADIQFPNQLAPFSEKNKKDFGLKLAHSIQSEWFYGYNANAGLRAKYYTQRYQFIERRAYAKGLQSMDKYKQQFKADGDKSFLNLSSKPISIIPKLVDIVVNGMADRDYSIRASSTDPIGYSDKINYRKNIENDMNAKDIIQKAKDTFGIDVGTMPLDKLPASKEELDLHMDLEYKQSIELSAELAISEVLNENRYNETVDRMTKKDLMVLGLAWQKHTFVPDRGIVVEYVNPENKIQSYSEDPYYRDCFYHGEFKTVPISDVLIEFQWLNLPENENLKAQLSHSSKNWWDYHRIVADERIPGTTNLLYFTYKTTRDKEKKIIETETGGKEIGEFVNGQNVNKDFRKYKKISIVEEVLFEGVYVLGTDLLLKWEVSENMARPKSNKQKVVDQYIGIAPNRERGYIDSLVSRMMPVEDKLNILELKAEQIIQKMMPDGFVIDPDSIAELEFADGQSLNIQNVVDMFWQTGSIFARSIGAGGDPMYSKPITELRTAGSLDKLNALRAEREGYMNMMRDVIGMNKASDASSPDKDSILGVQKIASLATSIATRHILDGASDLTKRMAEGVFYRVADLLKFSDLKDDFSRKIGATAIKDIDEIKTLHLYDFAIFLDLAPDIEEKAKLENDLSISVEKGFITVSDKYKILNIKNLKLAVQYLDVLIKKNQKVQQEMKMQDIQANAQSQMQSAQQSEAFKQETAKLEAQVKGELQNMINQGELAKEKERGAQDRETLQMKIEGEIQVANINGNVAMHKFTEGENRKDDRTKIQATQQSQLIAQRQKDKDPKDFENEAPEFNLDEAEEETQEQQM